MSILDVVSTYNHAHLCDWIHNVLIIMLFLALVQNDMERSSYE